MSTKTSPRETEYVSDAALTVVMDSTGDPIFIGDCTAMIESALSLNPGAYLAAGDELQRIVDELKEDGILEG